MNAYIKGCIVKAMVSVQGLEEGSTYEVKNANPFLDHMSYLLENCATGDLHEVRIAYPHILQEVA